MKLAIIGYGRMGHEIEAIAVKRGHNVVLTIDKDNLQDLESEKFKTADVAIEFTFPESAVSDYLKCFKAGVPVVTGTTGWLDQRPMVEEECRKQNGGFLYASNFSLGVNLFFELNRKLAELMAGFPDYSVRMNEIHHIHKLDAPSGTAKSLGALVENAIGIKPEIEAFREGEVPGIHTVEFKSGVDKLTFTHEAFSREGLAEGAVVAAEMTEGLKGVHEFKDLIIC